jgi:hypothetical protein
MKISEANIDRKIITYYIKEIRPKLAKSIYTRENPSDTLEK